MWVFFVLGDMLLQENFAPLQGRAFDYLKKFPGDWQGCLCLELNDA